jgi:hypothetical protein
MASNQSDTDSIGTNIVPLLLLIYGILTVAALYGIVTFLQHYRFWPFYTQNKGTTSEKIRETVNHKNATSTSPNEALLSSLDKKMMELNSNALSKDDISVLLSSLQPTSTSWDVMLCCLAIPSTVSWSCLDYERVLVTRQLRIEQDQRKFLKEGGGDKTKKDADDVFDALFNDDSGWDDADDTMDTTTDEHKTKRAAEVAAEAKRKTDLEQLKKASGQGTILLEGIDQDVLGQLWVEEALRKSGVWPPKSLGVLSNRMFDFIDPTNQNGTKKESLDALSHPGIRRTLCMVVARCNSMKLNGDSELLNAGMKQLIDPTYFKPSMEFRNRISMLLEACIELAATLKSYHLLVTILTTMTAFKIGVTMEEKTIPWFNTVMTQQYNMLPRLKVHSKTVQESTPNKDDATTNDIVDIENEDDDSKGTIHAGVDAEVVLTVERIHAAHFLKVKAEQFQKQGIPPQIGLQSYRERWWFMLRKKRLADIDGKDSSEPIIFPPDAGFTVDPSTIALFEAEESEYRLLTAWPMTITNVAQQKGQVKVQFPAPDVAGKYKYFVRIQSADFLGADQELEFDVTVLDKCSEMKSSNTKDDAPNMIDEEPKKDK